LILSAIILSSVYLVLCFYLSCGLKNAEKKTPVKNTDKNVSVVVCARNEEKNIAELLDCLLNQTYHRNKTQIIVVNDRSTDKTFDIALSYKDKFENFLPINVEETQNKISPKKFAFQEGMRRVNGEIVVQTDADSFVPPDWIETIIAPFFDESVALVQGIVKYRFEKPVSFFLEKYQTLDFLSHGIVAAAGIGKNIPLNANANNFAFRREAYENSGGYGNLINAAGGDDGLLMQKIWQSGKKICFNADCVVETRPEYSWKDLLNQRKKWASETRFYLPKQSAVLSLIFIFYCFTLLSLLSLPVIFMPVRNYFIVFSLFVVKILGESLFMYKGLLIFGEKKLFFHIIWVSPINLFLTVYSVLSGIFGKFNWKGGEFASKIKLPL
jgi:cellulose synthase/poly-beta-1,6-N-acetylglucosamine synthase-like glycosyltransferase